MEYNEQNRGIIQHHNRAKQIIEFKGLNYGNNITPTDIDGIMEWHKLNAYVIYELKYNDAQVPYGQRMALKEMVDDFIKAGKSAVVMICRHQEKDPDQDVIAAESYVYEYYCGSKWYRLSFPITCKEVTDRFWEHLWKQQEK